MIRSQSIENQLTEQKSYSLFQDISMLVKLRLSSIVVFSAGIGYAMAVGSGFLWNEMALLLLGGLLVTASANAINEVIERDTDAVMDRTKVRPLPAGRMRLATAALIAGTMGVVGVSILWFAFGPVSALLGALALLSYAFIYTPLKRISPIAVFVGAFPGALPPLIGWTAATGAIESGALVLFAIQFFWQFPHFWAIAWLAKDDYAKAGFQLMPDSSGRSKTSALYVVLYTAVLVPIGILPLLVGMSGVISAVITALAGAVFTWQAIVLYRTLDMSKARALMFGSFIYLPVVFAALVIDKL